MKNKIYTALLSLAMMAGFTACNEKWEPDSIGNADKGSLSTAGLAIDLANAENVIESRASYDLSNFVVSVVDKDGLVVNEWVYSAMPSLPSFNVGTYTLKVASGTPQKAAWNAPYFVGEKQFEILKDEITNAGVVTCTLNNLKVTVKFSEDLIAASDGDIECEIRVNEDGVLRFTPAETRSGYFEVVPGNTTMVATFTGTVNGYNEEIIRLYKDLSAGQHRIISFSLKGADIEIPAETGYIDPVGGLNVDFSVVDEDLGVNVNPGDEEVIPGVRPGENEEFPNDPGKDPDVPTPPSAEAATFDAGALSTTDFNIVSEVSEAVVNVNCPKLAQHFYVTIESSNQDFLDSAGELMPLSFDLVKPVGEDGTDYSSDLSSIGLPVGDEVYGQSDVKFDITGLVPLLSAFEGEHVFTLRVVDMENNESELKLKFKSL